MPVGLLSLCHAHRLPGFVPRRPISDQLQRNLAKLCRLLRQHFPDRPAAPEYLETWSSRRTTEGLEPPLDLTLLLSGRSFVRQVLHHPRPEGPRLDLPAALVSVARARPGSLPPESLVARAQLPEFDVWLGGRLAQGVTREQAIQEWNGAALLRQALAQRG